MPEASSADGPPLRTIRSPQDESTIVLRRLANYMRLRHDQGLAPFALLLGAGASVPSDYPTARQFVAAFLQQAGVYSEELDDDQQRVLFDRHWDYAGDVTTEAFVSKILPPRHPSRGYFMLADLVAKGFLSTICTTNVDTLLDQVFAAADPTLREHQILVYPSLQPRRIKDAIETHLPRVKILKVHGDLRLGSFLFTAEELREFPPELASALRSVLHRDLIVIGHALADEDLQVVFTTAPEEAGRTSIFYINPNGLATRARECLRLHEDRVELIQGELADFDTFMDHLYAELLGGDPRASVTFGDQLSHKDLQGFQWLWGRYWASKSGLVLGAEDGHAGMRVGQVWLGEADIELKFDHAS
jgi:hypothetical protein